MIDYLLAYQPLLAHALLDCGFAFSQYVVLRAGVFSIATAGFASLGAYSAAVLATKLGVPPALALVASAAVGTGAGLLLSLPLARLRGVFQAIATLAFVQVVMSGMLNLEDITGGALGLNGIPKTVETWHLAIFLAVLVYLMSAIGRCSFGRAFDAARQDETVAVSLGVDVSRHHALAFALSGAIGGLTGGLYAFHSYSLVPEQFGFSMLVASLAAVVLGGRISVWGPVVGAALLAVLPELARSFAEQRYLVHGALLMLVIIYLPDGLVDTINHRRLQSRTNKAEPVAIGGTHGAPVA